MVKRGILFGSDLVPFEGVSPNVNTVKADGVPKALFYRFINGTAMAAVSC